jgi:hypothetical protein
MTIHINVKAKDDPYSEIAISSLYNGKVWLSYAEQVELVLWLRENRGDIIKILNNRRFKESLGIPTESKDGEP